MTFEEAVAELKVKFPKAGMSPSATCGQSVQRATGLRFKKDRGGMFAGVDGDGTEVLVYYNDTAELICCTEIESFGDQDEE
jgi:hypothetical protein